MTVNRDFTAPITINYMTITTSPIQWASETIILYVLNGTLTVRVNENQYHLEEDDLILINAYDLHSFKSSSCKVAMFSTDLTFFRHSGIEGSRYYFDCNAATIRDKSMLIPLKRYLALLIKNTQSTRTSDQLLMYSYAYELMHHLVDNYYVESQNQQLPNRQRLAELLIYINSNYRQPLTLKSIAEQFYMSPPYLSKVFKEAMGLNFRDYINDLRLNSAISDLRNLDWTIDHIAGMNGFANTRSFVQVFRNKYKMLPSDYRHQLHKNPSSKDSHKSHRGDPGIIHRRHLGRLADYLNSPATSADSGKETVQYSELPMIAVSQKGLHLTHAYRHLTTIGMARHLLLANFQEMLCTLQQDIGFKYIKFHGLLDDEMMVYSENADGKPQLNFSYIDAIFDFLLSIDLKPIMQLSYMPKDLAEDPSRTINFLESHVSLPKDYNKWTYLIRQLVIHLQNRYGPDEIRCWPFYLWNTPDAPEELSGINHKEEYFHFYKVTYEAVKSIDPDIIFGGPALMNGTMEDGQWVTDFINYSRRNHCIPAFLNYHFYPVIMKSTQLSSINLTASNLELDPSEDALHASINRIKRNNRDMDWQIDQFFITEWNSSISHRELLNDTAFKPAYIVKNLLENYDRMSSFAFWSLTDFIEEVQMSGKLFHGGLGLFTYNGIKKAQYYAFAILSRMGDELLGKGEGYFVTRKASSYQIIFYNYQHYSSLYASGELFDMTFENRYTPFPSLHSHKYILPISDLGASNYIITDTILNRNNGSAFDKWIDLGAMPLETEQEVDYLKSISIPKIHKSRESTENGQLIISRTLQPHEVRLVEIKPEFI